MINSGCQTSTVKFWYTHLLNCKIKIKIKITMSTTATNTQCHRFDGKIAVITASTDGIGYATAKRLGLEGATVMISSRKQHNVDNALKKLRKLNIKCEGITCHVGKMDDLKNLISFTVSKYKKIDALIACGGINPATDPNFWNVTQSQLTKMFDTNVFSQFWLVKFAKDYMPNDGSASITFLSSVGAHLIWRPTAFYSISKLALHGLTKLLYQELTPKYNIRVNCVAPGMHDYDMCMICVYDMR